ncbi:MAG: acyl carrier protein [Cyanobacteria bacterium J06638_7]
MHAGPDKDSTGAASPSPGASGPPRASSTARSCLDLEHRQARLIEILQRISGADPEQITPEARLIEDIGIDSLGFYEILIEADEALGIKIREEDLLGFRTVGDVQRHLESLERDDGQG